MDDKSGGFGKHVYLNHGIALQSDDPEKTARNTANARKAYDTALLTSTQNHSHG